MIDLAPAPLAPPASLGTQAERVASVMLALSRWRRP
jgi:hypothetical protein